MEEDISVEELLQLEGGGVSDDDDFDPDDEVFSSFFSAAESEEEEESEINSGSHSFTATSTKKPNLKNNQRKHIVEMLGKKQRNGVRNRRREDEITMEMEGVVKRTGIGGWWWVEKLNKIKENVRKRKTKGGNSLRV
ncbi:unnamed protein product [Cuscuta epithymum]|uniref:Uncharacterized protein n=1 Tax=Cuscuta epithymum TaxID=186058 RepID=A0AAV0FCT9_9ASTE|nr:unnamed protein product [Cuscuta epithymum]